MAELVDQHFHRHPVLERERDHCREAVHEARECGALLGHGNKDLPGLAVLKQSDGEVPFVPGDRKLVRDGLALVRQAAPVRRAGNRLGLVLAALVGRERLDFLGAVAVDGDGLDAKAPRLGVGLHDVLDRGLGRQVHGLTDRPRDERLDRPHHPDVAHVVDRAGTVDRAERAVKNRQVLRLEARCTFNGFLLIEVLDDGVDLPWLIAQALQRARDGLVDDLQHAAADQPLVLDERDVRLDAGRIAIEHKSNRAGRGDHRDLRVAHPVRFAVLDGGIPRARRGVQKGGRHQPMVDLIGLGAVLAQDAHLGIPITPEPLVGPELLRDLSRDFIGVAAHERGDGARPGTPFL